jgi:2,4'-dihydroxyacetophenone dioxygenase
MTASDIDVEQRAAPTDLTTFHMHSDDIPWIEFLDGVSVRILHARLEDGVVVTQIRARPGAESGLHRHLGPVFGWTNSGQWGHNRDYEYRPGTYIFEPPGVIHKFLAGSEPVDAVYISHGTLEQIDPQTLEVTQTITPEAYVANYLAACDKAGIARPDIFF